MCCYGVTPKMLYYNTEVLGYPTGHGVANVTHMCCIQATHADMRMCECDHKRGGGSANVITRMVGAGGARGIRMYITP
jgi:hypothetical protein